MITVGVVIDVPEPYAARIDAARRAWGDPDADAVPPHITLVAPVSLDPEAMPAVTAHVADAAAAAHSFEIRLRGTGTFRPVSPVVFLAIADGISSCELLEASLRSGPLAVDLRFPYHPHVTIAAELADPVLDRAFEEFADFECSFPVTSIALYVLGDGGWSVQREYPLGS